MICCDETVLLLRPALFKMLAQKDFNELLRTASKHARCDADLADAPSRATYIAAKPRNILVANNMYDAEYMKHFTGLNSVTVLPSLCVYTKQHTNQCGKKF